MKVMFDTCVILDALQDRYPFNAEANVLIKMAGANVFTACITAKSITDIYYVSHRATHNDKASREIITGLYKLFDIVDTCAIDCRKAIPSKINDYEDAIMVETALRENIDLIVTRNTKDYINSPVKILTPKEFLNVLYTNN